ncbi:multidrug resistance protein 1, 2, 3 [Hypoxylon sp. FL1150]|nr:multidrug resistance protein 1, 2, 3 [Hypoxylon sp. FL1150]
MAVDHLDETARWVLDRQLNGLPSESSTRRSNILSFGTWSDRTLLLLSVVFSLVAGGLNPLLTVIYGQFVGIFTNNSLGATSSSETYSGLSTFALYFVYLAVALLVFITMSTLGFYYSGERIVRSMRISYLEATIRQNMAFFDVFSPGELSAHMMSSTGAIQEGITGKASTFLTSTATFLSALIIAFAMYWKTALILLPAYAIIVAISIICGKRVMMYQKLSKEGYASAAGIAEEAISTPRHIAAYGLQKILAARYDEALVAAGEPSIRARKITAGLIAWLSAMPCLLYALVFWSGTFFLLEGELSVAQLTTTALTIVIGAFAIIRVSPSAEALLLALSSVGSVLKTISRRSAIDPLDSGSLSSQDDARDKKPQKCRALKPPVEDLASGVIEFRNVSLAYPSRPDVLALHGVSFTCQPKKITAIVGASGSGKSSLIELLERFYDPIGGSILVAGHDIRNIDVSWLRQQMSLIGQEPVLFDATIADNILMGLRDLETASSDEIRAVMLTAARKANAHDFITALPEGYDTEVGERGARLSGGQRQRIAISRGLARSPSILLLDEATSALDSRSEATVQKAIEAATENQTTIIIAHRLSTIRNAHHVVVLSKGRIVEQGSPRELLDRQGAYAELIAKQQIGSRGQAEKDITSEDLSADIDTPELTTIDDDMSNEKAAQEISDDHVLATAGPDNIKLQADAHTSSLWATLVSVYHFSNRGPFFLLAGLACSFVAGLGVPGQSVVFAKVLSSLPLASTQPPTLRHTIDVYSAVYLGLAFVAFASYMSFGTIFSYTTESLSRGVRNRCFRSVISQDVGFFDHGHRGARGTGAITSVLTTSAEAITALSGPILGGVLTFMATIATCLIMSVSIAWRLALVCSATIPVVFACGWVRLRMLSLLDATRHRSGTEAAAYASEIVKLVRVVASLGIERRVLVRYEEFLAAQAKESWKSIILASVLYGFSQSVVYLCAALAFWYGGTLLDGGGYSLFQFYLCFAALISGTQTAGSVFSYAPDASKAMRANGEVQALIKLGKEPTSAGGMHAGSPSKSPRREEWQGGIEMQAVTFGYESRPNRRALDRITLKIEPGQHIALVGRSGSGKSTIVSLLERFYEPNEGSILLDGRDVSALDLEQYRELFGLVSQDTVLYAGNIRDNIAVGRPAIQSNEDEPGVAEVSDQEIAEVCAQANLTDFIASLPDGIRTNIGPGGSLLSGGQKQRIAIARALIRNPKILLLDEATSALDTESEIAVQKALDEASKGRTTISIAHRLATVVGADVIYVLEEGRIVETGTHQSLIEKKGEYFRMVMSQVL